MSFESGPENDDDDDDDAKWGGRLTTLSTRGGAFPWRNNDFSALGNSRGGGGGGGGGWNYMTHQYFAEERYLENWAPNDAEENLWDDDDAEGRGRAQQQRQQRGYNLNYARQQRAMQLKRQHEYRQRIEQQQFRTSRIFCDDDDEEDVEERREAQEAFRDVPDEHNENRNGGIAILSQTKRAILVDVKGITDKEGKLCSKYVLECELPGVGVQNISFKTTKCTDREGCVFSIEVTRRKEDVKEKENVWRKVMMQKKKKNESIEQPSQNEEAFQREEVAYRTERGAHRKYVQRRLYIPGRYALSLAKYKDGVAIFEFTFCEEGRQQQQQQQIAHQQTFDDI